MKLWKWIWILRGIRGERKEGEGVGLWKVKMYTVGRVIVWEGKELVVIEKDKGKWEVLYEVVITVLEE